MNQRRIVVAIVLGIGMIATFLPWVHVPIVGAIYGTKGDGWITFGLFAAALAVTGLWGRSDPLVGLPRIVLAALSAGAAIVGVWKMIELNDRLSQLGDNPIARALTQTVGMGPGLYLVLVAGILAPIIAFVPGGAKAPER
jgi:hypothetical protein